MRRRRRFLAGAEQGLTADIWKFSRGEGPRLKRALCFQRSGDSGENEKKGDRQSHETSLGSLQIMELRCGTGQGFREPEKK